MLHLRLATLLSLLPIPLLAQERFTGEIAGAEYIVDVPAEPSGDVMFIGRGFRPAFFPVSPVYEVGTNFYQTLLTEGWTIASTAFQTNDWVVAEGGRDILALQAYIGNEIHPIKRSFLYGETMGGGVSVWLAENHPESFSGVLCLGAHLFPEPDADTTSSPILAEIFNLSPQIPILFLANTGETASSQAYVDAAQKTAYQPIIWKVDRTGHVNVNSAERLAAMNALVKWTEGTVVESVDDATLVMEPTSIAAFGDSYTAANITGIRPLYGNIYTNFVPADLAKIGVGLGDRFTVTHGTQTHQITFAKAYSDVPYEAWVAFVDSEGHVQISRNYANAADTIGANKGDPLILSNKK